MPPRPMTPRGPQRGGPQHQRALAMCQQWVDKNRGAANFDQIYRHLVGEGIGPNDAHLAIEQFMHDQMMKRVKK